MTMQLSRMAAALIVAMSVSATASAATLRLAHATPQSDLQHVLAEQFKEAVESASGGELNVQIFPNGQLGNDAQMIDGARSGIIDIAMSGLNNFTGLVPEATAFTLPFMFEDSESAWRALDGEPGEEIMQRLESFGLKGLAFPENGFREMTNSRGPIREPADLDGLRMRVNNSITLSNMFELLGANPQQVPVSELYTALETGVVNAQDHPLGIVVSFNFDEVQDYLSMTHHAYSPLLMVMNRQRFEGLTPEQQAIVQQAADEATDMQRRMSVEQIEEMIAGLEADGMQVNRDVNVEAFREAVQPVWQSYIDENGDELVDRIRQAAQQGQ